MRIQNEMYRPYGGPAEIEVDDRLEPLVRAILALPRDREYSYGRWDTCPVTEAARRMDIWADPCTAMYSASLARQITGEPVDSYWPVLADQIEALGEAWDQAHGIGALGTAPGSDIPAVFHLAEDEPAP